MTQKYISLFETIHDVCRSKIDSIGRLVLRMSWTDTGLAQRTIDIEGPHRVTHFITTSCPRSDG